MSAAPEPGVGEDVGRDRRSVWWRGPFPVLTLAGVVVGILTQWWLHAHRSLGSLNLDEATFTTQSLRLFRHARDGAGTSFLTQLGETAPLVPLSTLAPLAVGVRSTNGLLVVQSGFHLVAVLATASVVRRVRGDRAAVVAGIVALASSGLLTATRALHFGVAVAATLMVALACLAASEGGRRVAPMAGFGAAVGLLAISRSMALAYLPAVLAAAAVVLRPTRLDRRGASAAVAAAAATALWWWVPHGARTWEYLVGFGYDERRRGDLERPLWSRVPYRVADAVSHVGGLVAVAALVAVVGGTWCLRRRGWRPARRPWSERTRLVAALAVTATVGYLALFSTYNDGQFFSLALLFPLVAIGVILGGELPGRLRGAVGVAASVAALAGGTLSFLGPPPSAGAAVGLWQSVDLYSIRSEVLVDDGAGGAWWDVSRRTARAVGELERPDRLVELTVVGNASPRTNAATVTLAVELVALEQGRPPPPVGGVVGDEPVDVLEARLRPRIGGRTNVVVVVLPARSTLWGAAETRSFRARAGRAGWEVRTTVAHPDGGRTEVLTHPEGARSAGDG